MAEVTVVSGQKRERAALPVVVAADGDPALATAFAPVGAGSTLFQAFAKAHTHSGVASLLDFCSDRDPYPDNTRPY